MRRAVFLVLLTMTVVGLLIGTASAQQFYKWTDASGATHYADHPPEKGKASTVTVKSANGAVPPPQLQGETPDTAKRLDDAEAASRRRSCLTAQNNLKILQGEGAILDGESIGQATTLNAQRRVAAKEKALNDIDKNCGPKS
jgi:hypothetical protein